MIARIDCYTPIRGLSHSLSQQTVQVRTELILLPLWTEAFNLSHTRVDLCQKRARETISEVHADKPSAQRALKKSS